MSRVYVCGVGAVSPAGWGVPALLQALQRGQPLPVQDCARPGWTTPLKVRAVPAPSPRPPFLAHPRLRRTSPIAQYAAAAALEATTSIQPPRARRLRLGLVVCLQAGCVQYSERFFREVLHDPPTASPMLFPETVLAAPASHVAAILENTSVVDTFMGDPSTFLNALAHAIAWLEAGLAEASLVIGADEPHWLVADALRHLEPRSISACGAGAVCITLDPALSLGVELSAITDAFTYHSGRNRTSAARAMRQQLEGNPATDLLCDGAGGSYRADAPENAAWMDWTGARLTMKRLLGEGLVSASALQCVAACAYLAKGCYPAANVSLVGPNQQAIGARFVATSASLSGLSWASHSATLNT